jgi:hypothetical protein
MAILVFDIETIPDARAGAQLHPQASGLETSEIIQMMLAEQRAKNQTEFLPHTLHQIVAISVALAHDGHFKAWSLGEPEDTEKTLIERFWLGLEKYQPTLVSWNGSGFDLPVLHYRTLFHKLQAPLYWEVGENNNNFKWNNYLNRYHLRHLDVMDMLSGYQNRAFAGLDTIATLCGLPGKQGMSGGAVLEQYQAGNIEGIRDYCETDVLNTYLVYLRFQWMRGQIDSKGFKAAYKAVVQWAQSDERPVIQQFISAVDESFSI